MICMRASATVAGVMKCPSMIAAAALLVLSGCASPRPEGTWVSRVGTTDAWLAVTLQDTHAVAFICGGEQTLTTHTRWMYNTVDEHDEALAFEVEGWRLDLELTDPGAAGELTTPAGDVIGIGATLTAGNDLQGIYSSVNGGCRDGLIVIDSGDGPQAQGVYCDNRGHVRTAAPAEPLAEAGPDALTDGLPVVATSRSKRYEFVVLPLVASELAP
jgi:hypothetical protein